MGAILVTYIGRAFIGAFLIAVAGVWVRSVVEWVINHNAEVRQRDEQKKKDLGDAIREAQKKSYEDWKTNNFIRETGDIDQDKLSRHMDQKKPIDRGNIDFEIG